MLGRLNICIRGRLVFCCALAFVAPVLVAGCSDDKPAAAGLEPVEVMATDNEYTPDAVTLSVGQTVVWTNVGENQHDIIPLDPAAGFGIDLDSWVKDSSYAFTFLRAGEYAYYCSIHGTKSGKGMAGTVSVTG